MGKRQNVGIYIGPGDLDIAAWFNLLQSEGLSRSQWVRGLLCAYSLGVPLSIGCISDAPAAPPNRAAPGLVLAGTGTAGKKDRWGYGWQVRGPDRSFIVGSVVNISLSKRDAMPILNEVWANGQAAATFVKALIRQHLGHARYPTPPKGEDLQSVFMEYRLRSGRVPEEPAANPRPGANPSPSRAEGPRDAAGVSEKRKNPLLGLF